jgi:hypothetical protein
MIEGQARRSAMVMGFDIPMIAGSRAWFTSTRPIHPAITNETSPHHAEALALHQAGDRSFNEPDGNAWILQERPGARDGRRGRGDTWSRRHLRGRDAMG